MNDFSITETVVSIMNTLGAPGAGFLIAIENLFPPIPSELILPLAGFVASQGDINLYAAIAWTTAGSVVGAVILYYVGALLGRERMRTVARYIPLVNVKDVDKTEAWFAKHGSKAVFYGRMLPLFRSFISIPAGIERMPLLKFIGLTAAGSFIWNTVFIVAGYLLGENYEVVEQYATIFQAIILVAIFGAAAYFVTKKLQQRRSAKG